tara:strand:- start:1784 stop:2314 length:531 start_codon:yes stop_codon:yes gene_type:complete
MKFKNLYYFVIIIYLISSKFSYSIERPDIKNLIVLKDKKKIENIEFINSEGHKLSLNNYKSNIIIINLWATWCTPCIKEMPSLNRLKLRKKFKNVEILPINIGRETYKKSKSFFESLNIKNLEIYLDETGEIPNKLLVRGIPTTILIDKNGYEFARIVGYIDFENKIFLDWLNNYL